MTTENVRTRKILLFLMLIQAVLCFGAAGCAKQKPSSDIELVPFTAETFRISSVVPANWVKVQPGYYKRSDLEKDPTGIIYVAMPEFNAEALALLWLSQMDAGIPPSSGSRETDAFNWDLYSFEFEDEYYNEPTAVTMALAESETGAYLVLLFSRPDEHKALYEAVFLPAVDAFSLASKPTSDQTAQIEWKPLTSSLVDFESIVPAEWTDFGLGSGMYMRDVFPDSPVLFQTEISDASTEDPTPGMLADLLNLKFASPEDSTSYNTEALNWTLYSFEARRLAEPRTVAMALAKKENTSYAIVLHAPPDEYDVLYEGVFLPVVDAFTPSDNPRAPGISTEWYPFIHEQLGIRSTIPPGWNRMVLDKEEQGIYVWIPDAFTDALGSRDFVFAGSTYLVKAPLNDLVELGPTLIQGGELGSNAQEFAAAIMPHLGVRLPESSGIYASATLTWTLYLFENKTEGQPPFMSEGQLPFVSDVALAETDQGAYVILLAGLPEEYDLLHEQVFMPVLEAFTVTKD